MRARTLCKHVNNFINIFSSIHGLTIETIIIKNDMAILREGMLIKLTPRHEIIEWYACVGGWDDAACRQK